MDENHDRAWTCANYIFARDRASVELGMKIIAVDVGSCVVAMEVTASMINAHDICHGGFIFTLADSTFAIACSTYNDVAVAQGAEISFLSPARLGEHLRAEAHELARYGRNGIYDVSVMRDNGELVALLRGRSRSLARQLLPNEG
ncbi:MAG: hydroxyphenylacetyl-CoA thioesterase PaaI [Ferrimicrobium sp.]